VFNLGTLNTLRGHRMFEFFPATGTLASFAFLVMTFAVSRRFFAAVVVMFTSGLLMAAYLLHADLVFALAWWLVLEGIGLRLLRGGTPLTALVSRDRPVTGPGERVSRGPGAAPVSNPGAPRF
jgi:hypothetical protein